jgi:hypothetical protein
MSQQTNLNVSPYFDDFDAAKDFHKVLFKPGFPVQARELTTLQSILQNQVEKFGQHFFKEGAKVIPGNTGYSQLYYSVQLNNTYLGIPVAGYAEELVGTKITGQTSGVSAYVDKVLFAEDSEKGNLTLYINYLNSSTTNNATQTFSDGESLICNTTISSGLLGNTSISAGTPFATTIAQDSTAIGSSFQIDNGVYFIRGYFVNVEKETLVLDQYTNTPNYRVGLYVKEEIINSDIDESLTDNSQGFNNFSAPGADRFKISTYLIKKSLTDFDDDNFIELATIENGNIRTKVQRGDLGGGPGYLDIRDTLARRTYDESGDYCVKPFEVAVLNSLNNNLGNRGIYQEGQTTSSGATPNDDLAIYKLSPGKAYVKGFELETLSPTFLDSPKPRTTKTLENQSINYNTGPTLKVNRLYGAPELGIGNTYIVSLRDRKVGDSQIAAPGAEIGVARIYDFNLESGSYSTSNSNLNEWDLKLFDVQTITKMTVNEPITLSVPTFIKGANSGATAFLKDAATSSKTLNLYEKAGTFIPNESLIIDGVQNGRIALASTTLSLSDVKSVFGTDNRLTGTASTFSADVIQSSFFNVGIATISAAPVQTGLATVTSQNPLFPGTLVKENNLVQYTVGTSIDPIVARVVSVGNTTITISGVSTVTGLYNGGLPSSTTDVTDFKVLTTPMQKSFDNTLFTRLPKLNVADVDLTDASLTIRRNFDVNISGNQLSTPAVAGLNETFLAYDDERYTLIRSDGSTELLTSDRVQFLVGGSQLQIYNLGSDDTGATLTATLRKSKPKAKSKLKKRVNSIVVNKSTNQGAGTGATTFNDGLDYGNFPFGTRVQDERLSLNFPDIIEIHGIFESSDTGDATAPKMTIASLNSTSTTSAELIIGELLVGQQSGAVAICAEKLSDSQITFVYKNDNVFQESEVITFQESDVTGVIQTLDAPSFDISSNYSYVDGQKGTIYGHGFLKKKAEASAPSRRIKAYFSSGFYDSSDDGDITTVNSYSQFNYALDLHNVNGVSVSDMIDIRPRVSEYTVEAGSRSPLEFFGRTFNADGNSAANILASDESIVSDLSYYQGRIDRIFLTKDGKMQVKYGDPADTPEKPVVVDDALEIATITLPPYLYDVRQASIQSLEHKRYRMVDIKQLENRIKNLEYYTALSLLETNTANLFVSDSEGLNRFKSGFFVDNFTSFQTQEEDAQIKNSIDINKKELRPSHYTNAIDLTPGPVVNVDPAADLSQTEIEGTSVTRKNDIVTLDYTDVEWLKQSFATRTESVTPFLISFWQGTLELTPATDTWVDTVRLEPKVIDVEGNYSATFDRLVETQGVDPQTGFGPITWGSWETNWTGTETTRFTRDRTQESRPPFRGWMGQPGGGVRHVFGTGTRTTIRDTLEETIAVGVQNRTGTRTVITEQFDRTSVGDRTVSRDLVPYMRSRNITFINKRVKPLTRLYAFFDGENVSKYCVPKLLEINMTSGTFQVGENVVGRMNQTGLSPDLSGTLPRIKFRVAQQNHREGTYNDPSAVYPENPYVSGQTLPSTYSSTSTILNVDLYSLSNQAEGDFSGYVASGMVLVGETSGATATVTDLRLISDLAANLNGSFFIPNPNNLNHPRFETGTRTLNFINDDTNSYEDATTISEESYTASGTLETVQENIISVRNARLEQRQEFQSRNVNESLGTQVVGSEVIGRSNFRVLIGWYDPLAQSFLVDDETGVFLTKCDVFFQTKDDMDIPLVFQLRTMENGFPTQRILPFSEVVVSPDDIQTSADGTVATTIEFNAPVFCEGGKEYAICLASNSTKYSVFISRVGENDLLSQTFISNQPYLGSLFKSQNASTWEPSQWEDLKFTLYRADFVTTGSVEFYNPTLSSGNAQVPTLVPNPLVLNSREIRVGLGSTLQDTIEFGNTVSQLGTNATGNLTATAGIATGTLNVIRAGLGYTPASGSLTFSGVNLVTVTGSGRGATANITVSNGVAIGATINGGGSGYSVGDVVGVSTIGINSLGTNMRLSVVSIASTNEFVLNNVQGDFSTGAGFTMQYTNSAGVTTTLNHTFGGNVTPSTINVVNDGLHIKVNHKNHGMYFDNNRVQLSGAQSDVRGTKLSAVYEVGSSADISVDDASNFSNFESVGVGTTNIGLLQIGDEVIKYTSVSGNTIGGNIVRGTNQIEYPIGTPVFKYELGGVSLARINKTHNLNDATVSNPIAFDSYNVKIDQAGNTSSVNTENYTARSSSESGSFPPIYFNQTKSTGGYAVKATQNIPFEIITPIVQNITVPGTTISAKVRTTTSSSLSGNEIPYIDNGLESVAIGEINYLDSARAVYSKVNADNNLTNLTGTKSLNMSIQLDTTDTRLSPVIDSQRVSAILTSNRLNSVITNYATDSRVNTIQDDPTACQYLSKEIVLENSATSLKVLLNGHINSTSDIRVFYAISDQQNFDPIYIPFPGYANLNTKGQVIALENSDGTSDALIPKTNGYGFDSSSIEYRDYTFTADDLPAFRNYRIKILLTGTNQVFVPRIKDLRVIALA